MEAEACEAERWLLHRRRLRTAAAHCRFG